MGDFRRKFSKYKKMTYWGFMGKILNFRGATPLGNESPLKHAVWCKNDGDTPKNVLSRAWQEIKK